MGSFTQVFGGSNIYPVQPSYSQLNYSSNVQLSWPIEQAPAGSLVVTAIMDLNPSVGSLTVSLPDARQVSTGYVALFNNVSGQTTSVLSNTGATLLSLVSGTVWQLYLVDNTTAGGTWRIFQFGASVSVAVAAALAGAGLIPLGSTLNENLFLQPKNTSYVTVATDRATIVQWTAGVGTFTLLAPGTATAGWFVWFKNQGSGNLTVSPTSGTIDGNASDTLAPGASAIYFTDGSNFFSLKGGGTAGGGSGFNLLQIDVSGAGNFALSGAQLNQIGYRFVGTLTGARHIVVPNTAQEYWVDNETTGAFTLDVGTSGQVSPIVVPQANRNILYCDGTNVINANTSTVVFPITIAQGGTSATTASVALTNLGGTTVGVNVFTAASAAAATTAISAVPTSTQVIAGTGLTGGGALSANVTLNVDFTKVDPLPLLGSGTATLNCSTILVGQEAIVWRSNNQSVTSSTVFVNDNVLQLTNLPAGTYSIEAEFSWSCAGGGVQAALVIGGSASFGTWNMFGLDNNTSPHYGVGGTAGTNAISITVGNNTATQVNAQGSAVYTGTGSIVLQWTQASSNAISTTINVSSWIKIKRLA